MPTPTGVVHPGNSSPRARAMPRGGGRRSTCSTRSPPHAHAGYDRQLPVPAEVQRDLPARGLLRIRERESLNAPSRAAGAGWRPRRPQRYRAGTRAPRTRAGGSAPGRPGPHGPGIPARLHGVPRPAARPGARSPACFRPARPPGRALTGRGAVADREHRRAPGRTKTPGPAAPIARPAAYARSPPGPLASARGISPPPARRPGGAVRRPPARGLSGTRCRSGPGAGP
jgi:hypothetical protein